MCFLKEHSFLQETIKSMRPKPFIDLVGLNARNLRFRAFLLPKMPALIIKVDNCYLHLILIKSH